MHPKLQKVLLRLRKESGPVFLTMSGNRLDRTTIQEKFKSALRRAGIKDRVRIHDIRHTFASHLAQHGTDLYRISRLLGHSSIRTTEMYAHLVKSDLVASISVLNF